VRLTFFDSQSVDFFFFQAKIMAEKNCQRNPARRALLFTKASEAAQRENLDYAIALFNQVLEKEPAFYECRKALARGAIQKGRRPAAAAFSKK
jgi:predicted Zn-dependent protease